MDEFNSMISLGYSILMNELYSEIEMKGLNPYFGFLHRDKEKHPTLASDLMEPFRILIDRLVAEMQVSEFNSEKKYQLLNVLNQEVRINGNREYVSKAIRIYVKSVCDAMEEQEPTLLKFYRYEK